MISMPNPKIILEVQDILRERLIVTNDKTLSKEQQKEEMAKTKLILLISKQYIALLNVIVRLCELPTFTSTDKKERT